MINEIVDSPRAAPPAHGPARLGTRDPGLLDCRARNRARPRHGLDRSARHRVRPRHGARRGRLRLQRVAARPAEGATPPARPPGPRARARPAAPLERRVPLGRRRRDGAPAAPPDARARAAGPHGREHEGPPQEPRARARHRAARRAAAGGRAHHRLHPRRRGAARRDAALGRGGAADLDPDPCDRPAARLPRAARRRGPRDRRLRQPSPLPPASSRCSRTP